MSKAGFDIRDSRHRMAMTQISDLPLSPVILAETAS